jgi:hypothetical protein
MTAEIYFALGVSIFAYGVYAIHRSIEWAVRESDRRRAAALEALRLELQSLLVAIKERAR